MKPSTVETWVWILIYSGLLLAALAWFLRTTLPGAALVLAVVGGIEVVAGAVLIWWRSRMGGGPGHDSSGGLSSRPDRTKTDE